jgi:hypothetical protein
MKPKDVDVVDVSFGATGEDLTRLMIPYEDIPKEFTNQNNKFVIIVNKWFFDGLRDADTTPKDGIDVKNALNHLRAIMASFEPKHEHKVACIAYLLSEWFEDIKYINSMDKDG